MLSAFPTACDDEPILLILVFIVFEGACGGTGLPEFPTACDDERARVWGKLGPPQE